MHSAHRTSNYHVCVFTVYKHGTLMFCLLMKLWVQSLMTVCKLNYCLLGILLTNLGLSAFLALVIYLHHCRIDCCQLCSRTSSAHIFFLIYVVFNQVYRTTQFTDIMTAIFLEIKGGLLFLHLVSFDQLHTTH